MSLNLACALMLCTECNKVNPEGAHFCAFCGKAMAAPDAALPVSESGTPLSLTPDTVAPGPAAPIEGVQAPPTARDDGALRKRVVGRTDDLGCPQCKIANAVEAEQCSACGTSLRETCAACSKMRRVGLMNCNLCGADGMASKIAVAHRNAAQKAMAERRLKDAIEELSQLNVLTRGHGVELGSLAPLRDWSEKEAVKLKAAREKAQRLAVEARARAHDGLMKGATEKLRAAAALDNAFDEELAQLLNPETQPKPSFEGGEIARKTTRAYDDLTGSVRKTTWLNKPDDSVPLPGVTALGQKPPTAKLNNTLPADAIKAKCAACGVVIVTRQAMLEKLTACPKCKAAPFQFTQVSS